MALIGLLLAGLGVTGCGGGEARLTKAQFLKQGNAICAKAQTEEVELATRYRKEQPIGDRLDLLVAPAVVPPLEKQLRRLAALNPPQAGEKKVETILGEMEKGIEDATADPIDLLVEETDPFARADDLAREYGLQTCAASAHAVVRARTP